MVRSHRATGAKPRTRTYPDCSDDRFEQLPKDKPEAHIQIWIGVWFGPELRIPVRFPFKSIVDPRNVTARRDRLEAAGIGIDQRTRQVV